MNVRPIVFAAYVFLSGKYVRTPFCSDPSEGHRASNPFVNFSSQK